MPAKVDRCVDSLMDDKTLRAKYPDEKERKSHAFAICNASMKGGEMDYGYIVQLAEGDEVPTRINALKVGDYKHPLYGEIKVTSERLKNFAKNVMEKVRGVDLDIDYAHKSKDDKAAGWVRSAEVEDDKLWLTVEWTPAAAEAIKNKEYRYFSPEFFDKWTDSTGTVHRDVLAGGGITNRPFMKDLVPLNFSEFDGAQIIDKSYSYTDFDNSMVYRFHGGNEPAWETYTITTNKTVLDEEIEEEVSLDAKKLAEILGVDSEEEDKLFEEVQTLRTFRDEHVDPTEEKAKAFAEAYPEEARMLAEATAKNALMESDSRVGEWTTGKNALPPSVSEGVRDFRVGLTGESAEKFDEIMAEIHKTGLVDIDAERGGNEDPADKDASSKFSELIDKKFEENKDKAGYTYLNAVEDAKAESPELAKAYVRG